MNKKLPDKKSIKRTKFNRIISIDRIFSSELLDSKKSQIQLLESVAVVIVVIFLLIIGIVFWKNSQKQDITQIVSDSEDLDIITLSKVASELPELKCYSPETVTKINCFDYYKILALNKTMGDPATRDAAFQFYNNYFHRSRITFQQLYPTEENITIYDNNVSATRSIKIRIPIVLEKNLGREGIKTFGMIIVEGYYIS